MKKYFLGGIMPTLLLVMTLMFTSCVVPVQMGVPGGERAQEERLYDNHADFIEEVKKNLGVPGNDDITYKMENPVYRSELEAETVYVEFAESGKTVAAAECYTKDGKPARSILNYTPEKDKGSAPVKETPKQEPEKDSSTVQYSIYSNSRYGYSIPYPDFMIPQPEAENGDGRSFVSQDGSVSMSVWGSHTPGVFAEASTLDGYYDYALKYLDYTPTYNDKGDNFFVLSGYRGDKIVYEKHILKSDLTENGFVIEYPVSKKDEFNAIVTYISKNMTTGIGEDSSVVK